MRADIYYSLLVLAGLASGFVDSIAGGGGLISLPAMLFTGMPMLHAQATNKLAATFGSCTSATRYLAAGQVESIAWPMAGLAFVAAIGGVILGVSLHKEQLNLLVTLALIAVGCFVAFRKDFGKARRRRKSGPLPLIAAFLLALAIGFYDGLVGPGTGTFLAFVFISVLGLDFLKATGSTKIVNFATNIAALLTYLLRGDPIHFAEGLVMGVAILAGAFIGSGMAVRIGPRFIRPLFVLVAMALAIKLVVDVLR